MQTQISLSLKTLPTLEQEDVGLSVAILQRLLVLYGYISNDQVNGIFGWSIDNAVRQFQHDSGLYEDGIVGHKTWCALIDLD